MSAMPEMTCDASRALWQLVSQKLEHRMGLHYGPAQWPQLERGLKAAAGHFGCGDALSCAQWLVSNDWAAIDTQVLARHLAIGESYFFRDAAFFQNLEQSVLPELLRDGRAAGRRLRIWSAGCSTGEEPYSVAMLIAGMMADWRDWDISILASDINEQALKRASAGIYGAWSLRTAWPGRSRDFLIERGGGRYEVDPRIRGMVSFTTINLAQDNYPATANATAAMDLILCRNVLIYFEAGRALSIVGALGRSLRPHGWLATGAVEMPLSDVAGLEKVQLPGSLFFRRGGPVSPAATVGVRQRGVVSHSASLHNGNAVEPSIIKYSMPGFAERLVPLAAVPGERVAVAKASTVAPPASPQSGAMGPETGAEFTAEIPADLTMAAGLAALARSHADKGELDRALILCAQAIEAEKDNAELTYLMATILLERGGHEEAAGALRRTLYLCPGHVLAHLALGGMARRLGNAETSDRHILKASARLSGHGAQEVLLAAGGMSAGQLQAAIDASRPKP